MCGIVGIHLKNPQLYPRLGEFLTPMLDCMTSRGPDSAGLALYRAASDDRIHCSLRADDPIRWDQLGQRLASELGSETDITDFGHAAVLSASTDEATLLAALRRLAPESVLIGHGQAMDVFKDVGPPRDICARFAIAERGGFQGIGHTRMATESAVTIDHSHPFAAAPDMSLVHNGTFSNPATVRRRLERDGITFTTDNDSEVAARLIAQHTQRGAGLDEALRRVLKELDGFFTLLVTTANQFAVMRDSFACKPAVIAEHADYVAVASEYHALSSLPNISDATVFEPMPEEVYTWTR